MLRSVFIDDQMPMSNSSQFITLMSLNKSMWPNLIEKGLMKVYGGYKKRNISPSSIVYALSSWPPERTNLFSVNRDQLWNSIITGIQNCEGTFILTSNDNITESKVGIKSSCAYSILEYSEMQNEKFLLLKNSAPNFYMGSDCEKWSKLKWNEISRKNFSFGNPNLDYTVFWIPYEEIFSYFSMIDMNLLPKNAIFKMEAFGIWKSEDLLDDTKQDYFSLKDNPQYYIEFNIPPTYQMPTIELKIIFTKLTLGDENEETNDFIALHIFNTNSLECIKYNENHLQKGFYTQDKDYMLKISINTKDFITQAKGNYIIVLSSKGRKKDLFYNITLLSSCPINSLTQIKFPYNYSLSIPIEMVKGISSGGNPSTPFYYRNPQFMLRFDPPNAVIPAANVKIAFSGSPNLPLNLFLYQYPVTKRNYLIPAETVTEANYKYQMVTVKSTIISNQYHFLVPSNWDQEMEGKFKLYLTSDFEIIYDKSQQTFNQKIPGKLRIYLLPDEFGSIQHIDRVQMKIAHIEVIYKIGEMEH